MTLIHALMVTELWKAIFYKLSAGELNDVILLLSPKKTYSQRVIEINSSPKTKRPGMIWCLNFCPKSGKDGSVRQGKVTFLFRLQLLNEGSLFYPVCNALIPRRHSRARCDGWHRSSSKLGWRGRPAWARRPCLKNKTEQKAPSHPLGVGDGNAAR